ncbi:MAG TPA: cytochrome b N-terminal domain-containing protein [Thermoanaerobaculia bacterium]|nr:cytochrome b N-terminal domain-containing protein [Thermoanaerobaculia bacterium]
MSEEKAPAPRPDATRARTVVGTFVLHLRPVRVPEGAIRLTHTFGLGGMSLVLLLVLAATGSLLMLVYRPLPGEAYESVTRLQEAVPFGAFVRAVHHWSANALIVVAFLHLLRVFLTGGHREGRELNWLVGLGLLAGVAGSCFTGYLLPWDQLAYWAVTIVTGMAGYVPLAGSRLATLLRGGIEIGPSTLINYYALHTQWLPATIFFLAGFHFWRVRKAGGVVLPPDAPRDESGAPRRVLFLPNLLWKETALSLSLLAAVTLFAALVRAPLGAAANPGMSPNPAKAPWYFLGFQELLVHLHPVFAVVVFPLAGALALSLLPYLPAEAGPRGAWFLSETGKQAAKLAAAVSLVSVPLFVAADELIQLSLGSGAAAGGAVGLLVRGLLPAVAVGGGSAFFYRFVRKRFAAGRLEATQAVFVLLVTGFALLTVAGIWFRGPGMRLTWPWRT